MARRDRMVNGANGDPARSLARSRSRELARGGATTRFSFCSFFVVPVGPCRTCTRTGPRSTVTAFLLTSLCPSHIPSSLPLSRFSWLCLPLSFLSSLYPLRSPFPSALTLLPSSSFSPNHFSRRFYSAVRDVTSFPLHQPALLPWLLFFQRTLRTKELEFRNVLWPWNVPRRGPHRTCFTRNYTESRSRAARCLPGQEYSDVHQGVRRRRPRPPAIRQCFASREPVDACRGLHLCARSPFGWSWSLMVRCRKTGVWLPSVHGNSR